MVTLVRVDSRLVHGQVVQAWLPHLRVARVVVADAEAAGNPLSTAAMALALGGEAELVCRAPAQLDFGALCADRVPTLLLVRDVAGAVAAHASGVAAPVNVGNVHAGTGRRQVTPSVHLSEAELRQLQGLAADGVAVEARAVPSERGLGLEELTRRMV